MTDERIARLISALDADGFQPLVRSKGISFRGEVLVRARPVVVRLDYDPDFVRLPQVFIEDPEVLQRPAFPHLDESGELCVVDRRTYLADRYKVAEQGRAIVRRTALVLEKGLWGTAVDEIATEFARYWSSLEFPINAPPLEGPLGAREKPRFSFCKGARGEAEVGYAVQTASPLSLRPGEPRPRSFTEFIDWLKSWDSAAAARLSAGVAALSPGARFAFVYAPNGVVGVAVKAAKLAPKQLTPRLWPDVLQGRFGGTSTDAVRGRRTDLEYLLGTNGSAGVAPLVGKNILLVGCGSIGGHLAFALGQAGAGLGGGTLTLLDPEDLVERNTARHRLGDEWVGQGKATAVRDGMLKAMPGLSVSAHRASVSNRQHVCAGADLVIDATGEQGVGDLLNEWMLQARAAGTPWASLLHVWIEGNGAAVQTYLSSDTEFGCFRCLTPELGAPPRYPVLRPGVETTVSDGCGEAFFNPYGPAAPMAAAALAAQHAVDWSRGAARPLLRSQRLSYDDTQTRKPTNPTKHAHCPICSTP